MAELDEDAVVGVVHRPVVLHHDPEEFEPLGIDMDAKEFLALSQSTFSGFLLFLIFLGFGTIAGLEAMHYGWSYGCMFERKGEPYRVDASLLELASPDAFVMHCLPAHPGEEITAEVLYGGRSAIWDEAENRMHVQKALMEYLVLGRIG